MAFDAFLSFTRKGHPDLAQRICRALDQAGMRVFMDAGISEGDSISEEIISALAQSKTLIAVYSRQYLGRNACQEELRRVFIAAEAEGDPNRRIFVVNPEEGNDHIAPAELRDARYVAARGPDPDLSGLIRAVRERSGSLPGPMSAIKRTCGPRWLPPRIPGTPGFVGRHRDLWRLHTALRAADFPLTHATSSGPAALVAGIAGIGKTSLAHAYAWHFGAAYPGGVYLTGLTGASDFDTAVARQSEEIRLRAASVRIPVDGSDREQVRVLMGEYLDSQPGPSLWIIDDLPPGLDPQILHQLVIPARRVRTVFISRDAAPSSKAATILLDGLTTADAAALLKPAMAINSPGERDAIRLITQRLGGHPLALTVVAADLRNRRGLHTYAEYAAKLEPSDDVLGLVGQSLRTLTPDERIVVELAGVLGSQPLPARLIEVVLAAVTGAASQPRDAGQVLDRLEMLALARRDSTLWHIHPLVSDAARLAGPAPASPSALMFAAARGILALTRSAPSVPPQETASTIRLARTLAASPPLQNTTEANTLRRLIAEQYQALGDVVEAARIRRLLAAAQPDSQRELTAAALACNACADYADAASLAHRALSLERTFPALWALADALDGLGRYAEANAVWQELDPADLPASAPQAEKIAFAVCRARAYLARGQLRKASGCLEAIRARATEQADDATVHQLNSATVQLAILRLQTGRVQEARRLARTVVAFYRDRNAEKHATCLAAELAWAEAEVTVPLLEIKPEKRNWAEAELTLQRLYDSYRESAGPTSVLTLTIAVQQALVVLYRGRRNKRASEIVKKVLPEIEARCGRKHPLWLRSHYILGMASLYQNNFNDAWPLLETAWTGQKEVLGPYHPETLITQIELGLILRLYDPHRSRQLTSEVLRALPSVTGRKAPIYQRAVAATILLPAMPAPLLKRWMALNYRLGFTDPEGR